MRRISREEIQRILINCSLDKKRSTRLKGENRKIVYLEATQLVIPSLKMFTNAK